MTNSIVNFILKFLCDFLKTPDAGTSMPIQDQKQFQIHFLGGKYFDLDLNFNWVRI